MEDPSQRTAFEEQNRQGAEEGGNLAGVTAGDSQHWIPISMASEWSDGLGKIGNNGNTDHRKLGQWLNNFTFL